MGSSLLPPRNATAFAGGDHHVQQGLFCQGGLMLSLIQLDGARERLLSSRGWAPTRTLGTMRISRALAHRP
jgi:hypothetical protein